MTNRARPSFLDAYLVAEIQSEHPRLALSVGIGMSGGSCGPVSVLTNSHATRKEAGAYLLEMEQRAD
ncbi:hypothetical protein EV646_109390 [Kribbella antiqua]|uniref:Uncharacterized protein n=1 Tax=Kribbella antiqua TaxID=2512217 RepID=A0A4R2IR12_9ACTN|nr:hypothetical protein EV646_109390 [Kribbella antiqua]